jgi:GTPase SAR1 family protein
MGIIMVYAINDKTSFNALENWMRQIKTHAAENVIKVLVGNKSDCAERQVSYDEGKKMADSFSVNFFEVSAKNNSNITETFSFLAQEIKEKVLSGDEDAITKEFPKGSRIDSKKQK